MTGIFNIYKEKGYTSHDAVAVLRKRLGQKRVGHTGTLDPQAEGVLPICVGRATKLAAYITGTEKTYQAELILGLRTDTDDHTGQTLSSCAVDFDIKAIEEAVQSFAGGYDQFPPMYSAIKVDGKRLYALARAGQVAERRPRRVEIYGIRIMQALPEANRVWLEVTCGKGTYIRSLCVDIGQKLGLDACMGNLARTRTGPFEAQNAVRLADVTAEDLIPADRALPFAKGKISTEARKAALNGHLLLPKQVRFEAENPDTDGRCWLYAEDVLVGLYTHTAQGFKPEVMLYANHLG